MTFPSLRRGIQPQIIAQHGIDAECIMRYDAEQNPGEQKPDPLEPHKPQPPSYQPRRQKRGNPIKDGHIEHLWFPKAFKRCTGLHASLLVDELNL